ncbi:MAG: E2F transcription factor-like E2FE [Trebouxia sp. A1-2]|nr:MAG: E2F transcription factor-like E2FE [Trebouxia sp. A1-2]
MPDELLIPTLTPTLFHPAKLKETIDALQNQDLSQPCQPEPGVAGRKLSDRPTPQLNNTSAAGIAERKEKSLGLLAQRFVQMLLCVTDGQAVALEDAAKSLLGGDEPPEDINKLKTKVRRLYDIANVLTSLNLIAKVHLKPARRPAFQWLGIDGICIQPQQHDPAAVTHLPTSLSALNPSPSEDISSTATGSSVQEQTQLRHISSCTQLESNINTTQADSQSTSNRCLKRNAAGLEPSSSKKCNRTGQLQRSPNPPQLSYGTVNSPSRPPPLLSHEQRAQSGKVDASPAVDQQPKSGKHGTRPTPVPITPDGGQTDVQRHKQSETPSPAKASCGRSSGSALPHVACESPALVSPGQDLIAQTGAMLLDNPTMRFNSPCHHFHSAPSARDLLELAAHRPPSRQHSSTEAHSSRAAQNAAAGSTANMAQAAGRHEPAQHAFVPQSHSADHQLTQGSACRAHGEDQGWCSDTVSTMPEPLSAGIEEMIRLHTYPVSMFQTDQASRQQAGSTQLAMQMLPAASNSYLTQPGLRWDPIQSDSLVPAAMAPGMYGTDMVTTSVPSTFLPALMLQRQQAQGPRHSAGQGLGSQGRAMEQLALSTAATADLRLLIGLGTSGQMNQIYGPPSGRGGLECNTVTLSGAVVAMSVVFDRSCEAPDGSTHSSAALHTPVSDFSPEISSRTGANSRISSVDRTLLGLSCSVYEDEATFNSLIAAATSASLSLESELALFALLSTPEDAMLELLCTPSCWAYTPMPVGPHETFALDGLLP